MITNTETPIRGLEGYTKWPVLPSTLDYIYAETVRGYKYHGPEAHDVHVDSWEGPAGPEKLMASSQIAGRWTNSIGACLAELDGMAHRVPGYEVTLTQLTAKPGPEDYLCVVRSTGVVLAKHSGPTFPIAILKCAIELALLHRLK